MSFANALLPPKSSIQWSQSRRLVVAGVGNEHPQVIANGLVQTVEHPRVGDVKLLGSVFKVDGAITTARHTVPGLGEHTDQVLAEARGQGSG